MRGERARALGVRTLDDLAGPAPRLRLGADLEFLTRPEWRSVREAYGLRFAEQRSYSPTFMYRAIADGSADVISAFSSDGRIAALDLVAARRSAPRPAELRRRPARRLADHAGIGGWSRRLRPLIGAIPVERMREAQPDGRPRRRQEDAGRGRTLARPGRHSQLIGSERLLAQHVPRRPRGGGDRGAARRFPGPAGRSCCCCDSVSRNW